MYLIGRGRSNHIDAACFAVQIVLPRVSVKNPHPLVVCLVDENKKLHSEVLKISSLGPGMIQLKLVNGKHVVPILVPVTAEREAVSRVHPTRHQAAKGARGACCFHPESDPWLTHI